MGYNVNVISGDDVEQIYSDTPIMGHEVLSMASYKSGGKVVAWRVNRILRPLGWVVDDDADVEFVDTTTFEGIEIYRSTLTFILALACRRAVSRDVVVRYSMSDSYYCEFPDGPASAEQVALVREEMRNIVASRLPIQMAILSLDKARRIFERQGNADRARLIHWTGADPITLYRCAGTYAYFGSPLAPNTGTVDAFDLDFYEPGWLL